MSQVYNSMHKRHIDENTNSSTFVAIPNFSPIQITTTYATDALVTLCIPDTWSDNEGDNAWCWFAVEVDGFPIPNDLASDYNGLVGLYTAPRPKARTPITLSGVVKLKEGTNIITPKWRITTVNWCGGGAATNSKCYIGGASTCTLTVIPFTNTK